MGVLVLLWPLSALYGVVVKYRYHRRPALRQGDTVPVIVVGNIVAGGSGKTPVVVAIAQMLKDMGYSPGLLARGYGAQVERDGKQILVHADSDVSQCGDEALMAVRQTSCPMAVGPDRSAALNLLLKTSSCDVVISDDGLQHYTLPRQVELVVIDAKKRFGNGQLLPCGPLREPVSRLQTVSGIIMISQADKIRGGDTQNLERNEKLEPGELFQGKQHGYSDEDLARIKNATFQGRVRPTGLVNLRSGDTKGLEQLNAFDEFTAVAGIGDPEKFFATLAIHNKHFKRRVFPDHHAFVENDLKDLKNAAVVMTQKDAVKCSTFAGPDWWVLSITVALPETFSIFLNKELGKQ